MRMYACQGNDPNPASSPPTMRLWAVCFAKDMPQPIYIYIYICKLQIMHRVHPYYITPKIYLVKYLITVTNLFS